MTADESKREVFQVPPSDGKGMTIRRIREIHEAEKAGKPLKLSAEEQEQYLAANKSVVKAARRLVGDGSQFESVSKKLNAILESGVVAKPNFAEQLARLPMPTVPRIPDLDVRPMSRLSQVEIDQRSR